MNICRKAGILRTSIITLAKYNASSLKSRTIPVAYYPSSSKWLQRCEPRYCTSLSNGLDDLQYEKISEDTLESLCEHLEILLEEDFVPADGDVTYASGVITLQLGEVGTYVINKQTPNKQIWLSSPFSGPKRYDFDTETNIWVYKHDGISLHELLSQELSEVLKSEINLKDCEYGRAN
ncbi:frataxin [Oratosquilla oratoria]|uniref:frataxin n=1 Tax=Oratosquilla oratoria TaxID=337810 RepID=UPI003F7671A8